MCRSDYDASPITRLLTFVSITVTLSASRSTKDALSRGYSLRRSGSGSRDARPYTARAGGLGNVPSGACRTARCSLHWCRRGSSRLHPVIPGNAALKPSRDETRRVPRWGAERRARPLHEVRAPWFWASILPYLRNGERTRAASLFDAASRWMRLSALRFPSFFRDVVTVRALGEQDSDANGHRENGFPCRHCRA